jgi:hypothetical protein
VADGSRRRLGAGDSAPDFSEKVEGRRAWLRAPAGGWGLATPLTTPRDMLEGKGVVDGSHWQLVAPLPTSRERLEGKGVAGGSRWRLAAPFPTSRKRLKGDGRG